MTPPVPVSGNRGDAKPPSRSTIYKVRDRIRTTAVQSSTPIKPLFRIRRIIQVSPPQTGDILILSQLIMTPIIFTSFIVSLTLVDFRHSANRAHYHADNTRTSRLPDWLHHIIYSYRRYEYVPVDEKGRPLGEKASGDLFYHSKQRKLMKMEVAEAFEIRSTVLVVLALLSLCVLWAVWKAVGWGIYLLGVFR